MNIKKVISSMFACFTPKAADEALFDAVAKNNKESLMITVKDGDVKVYVSMSEKCSVLAEALAKVAGTQVVGVLKNG